VVHVLEIHETDLLEIVHGGHQRAGWPVAGDEVLVPQILEAEGSADRSETDTAAQVAPRDLSERSEDLGDPRDVAHGSGPLDWGVVHAEQRTTAHLCPRVKGPAS